jgi:hypothetical protein
LFTTLAASDSLCSISSEQGFVVNFQDWLLTEGLSLSTAKKYAGALAGPLSKWGIDSEITSTPIAQIRDCSEFTILAGLIKATDIFSERNTRGNGMYAATLHSYSRYLAHNSNKSARSTVDIGPFSKELLSIERTPNSFEPFEPNSQADARQRVLREVVRRQGQPKFRASLMKAYQGRCAVSQCNLVMILDAAHVTPYLGPQTNLISNGILLRTDLHSLWDLALIAIDPEMMKISISPSIDDKIYQDLNGSPVFQPESVDNRISPLVLTKQWEIYQSHNKI